MAIIHTHTCVICGVTRSRPYPLETYVCFNCGIERRKVNDKAREGSGIIKKRKIREAGGKICSECGQSSDKVILHHIEAVALGGKTTDENTRLLCPECHKAVHSGVKLKYKGHKLLL